MEIVIPTVSDVFPSAKHDYIALSTDNDYIPVSSLSTGLRFEKDDKKVLMYGMFMPIDSITTYGRPNWFCKALYEASIEWVGFDSRLYDKKYYATNGLLLWLREDDYKYVPLMIMCVRKQYLFSIDRNNPDPSQFCLVIDRKLMSGEHIKMYRNVEKIYLPKVEENLDILYTNDIIEKCFRVSSIKLPQAKNVLQMLDQFRSINSIVYEHIVSDKDNKSIV